MVNHLRNALGQITHLPASPDKQRRELELLLALGRVLIDHEGSGSEAVGTTFERAHELCLALDEVNLLPRVYDGLVLNYHFTRSQPQKMMQFSSEMTEVYRRTRDAQALLMTRRMGSITNLIMGRFEPAREEM